MQLASPGDARWRPARQFNPWMLLTPRPRDE